MAENKIFVERETFEKGDKTYYSYFINGTIRGREVKIGIIPPDNGGFTVLDIVFGSEMSAELVLKPFEIKDEKSGQVLKGNSYAVRSVDENGEVVYTANESEISGGALKFYYLDDLKF